MKEWPSSSRTSCAQDKQNCWSWYISFPHHELIFMYVKVCMSKINVLKIYDFCSITYLWACDWGAFLLGSSDTFPIWVTISVLLLGETHCFLNQMVETDFKLDDFVLPFVMPAPDHLVIGIYLRIWVEYRVNSHCIMSDWNFTLGVTAIVSVRAGRGGEGTRVRWS